MIFPYAIYVPRSHICPSCLMELSTVRALADPHYGLPVVVCPRCSLACVRTKHPDQAFWQRFRRRWGALRLIFAKVLATTLMSLIMWGLVSLSVDVFATTHGTIDLVRPFVSADIDTMLGASMIVVLGIGLGCLVRVLYWHHRAWVGAVVLFLLAGFFTSLDYSTGAAVNLLAVFADFASPAEMPDADEMALRGQFFGMLGVLVVIGMVPGVFLGRMIEKSTVRKFRKIRKKIQRRRAYDN